MNRLDSGFYDDRQAEAVEGGRLSISNLATEEAGKRAAIGTRTTETKNWFESKITDLGQEEAQLKSQAESEFQKQVNAASDMERAYGIDSVEAAEQAQYQYQSRLDQISQYVQNKALTLAQIAAQAGNQQGIINAFQGVNPELQSVLGNQTSLNAAGNLANSLSNQWGMGGGGGANIAANMATYTPQTEEERFREQWKYLFG
jgi:molecular chaperone GrpE (heat shock protein)